MKLEAIGGGCKYHPNNNQLTGVCPSCLRDKLLKLYDNDNTNPTYPLPCPPPHQPFTSYVSLRHRHCRHSSNVMDSSVVSMASFNYGLKKSNSIAFASIDREVNGDNRGSKKKGIWSKLLKLTKKNNKEVLMHSRTMREGKTWH